MKTSTSLAIKELFVNRIFPTVVNGASQIFTVVLVVLIVLGFTNLS